MGLGLEYQNISLEIFPFVKEKNNVALSSNIKIFENIGLKFISVTYGASGSIQNNTLSLLTKISKKTSLNLAAHLTCVNSNQNFIKKILNYYWSNNIKNIVALGGDRPKVSIRSDYNYAYQLVKDIKENNKFNISVAFHPEGHPNDKDIVKEINNLKIKFDYGADQGISQFFFNADHFIKFRDKISKKHPHIKLIPGIILISNFEMIERFALKCKTHIPEKDRKLFNSTKDNKNVSDKISIEHAYNLCLKLKSEGINDFHIYTLNKFPATLKLLKMLK